MRDGLLGFTAVCCLATCLWADDKPAPKKEVVTFDGQKLTFAFEGKSPGETFKEYLPDGEKLDAWTKLASIRHYPDLKDPAAVVGSMAKLLKQQNPQAQSAILHNEKTGESLIDFITWPEDRSFVEFNIFKYSKNPDGGLVAQQYAVREYKDQLAFLKSLKTLRDRVIPLMAGDGLKVEK